MDVYTSVHEGTGVDEDAGVDEDGVQVYTCVYRCRCG